MDSSEDSKVIADHLTQRMMPQVPMAYINGRQWYSRTRPVPPEPAYLACRPRRLPNQHGAVGDGLPQKSASASGSARQDPERDLTPYTMKASPHLTDLFPSDGQPVPTTLAELVASSIAGEDPMLEISVGAITPSTSDGDPHPDSEEPTGLGQETKSLYLRDWKSSLSFKHDSLTDCGSVAIPAQLHPFN
ncbi:uncharacterized protein BKA55DRAFT_361554 [Fusarium redolens]|jgi:hypothetical protein|uniref:Uncharacterized protein n=1 Tax=Fusarium redolens TaxID=48865 RepID=A0A9P9H3N6_FUSRE|nr:uncharacterized protein BKA55DRAFT_361554 [Fusarium redolens]KAH7249773.1 hypothetical protein BKA55DRAFT_361554 [Fusarium redolens]